MTTQEIIDEIVHNHPFFSKYDYYTFMDNSKISSKRIEGNSKESEVVFYRQLSHVFAYIFCESLEGAAQISKKKEHTTVLYSIRRLYDMLSTNDSQILSVIQKYDERVERLRKHSVNTVEPRSMQIMEIQLDFTLNRAKWYFKDLGIRPSQLHI